MKKHYYVRKTLFQAVLENLQGEPNLIQVIIGPRQVGKTTLALQILKKWDKPKIYYSADTPDVPTRGWIADCWQEARLLAAKSN